MSNFKNIYFSKTSPQDIGVKVCGVTNYEDANICLNAGVHAVGFNFFTGSKRFIELETSRSWLERIDSSLFRVAVLVNPTWSEATALAKESFIDAIQLHGEESPEFVEKLRDRGGKQVIKALRIRHANDLKLIESYQECPILLDAFSKHGHGGTGETFDWRLLEEMDSLERIILSGGLNPSNIETALRLTKASFVDVASGVEESSRKKCPAKIQKFVSSIRNLTK